MNNRNEKSGMNPHTLELRNSNATHTENRNKATSLTLGYFLRPSPVLLAHDQRLSLQHEVGVALDDDHVPGVEGPLARHGAVGGGGGRDAVVLCGGRTKGLSQPCSFGKVGAGRREDL